MKRPRYLKRVKSMEQRNTLMLELIKLMVTLSTAAVGFLISATSTLFKDIHAPSEFYLPIGLFFACIIFSLLSAIGLLDRSEGTRLRFKFLTDKNMFVVCWGFFLLALAVTALQLT